MPRVIVPAAEELIDKPIPCLNLGHVMLIDYMGGDYSIVQAARVSYGKDQEAIDPEKDKKLIYYLMAHKHTTPFEMIDIKVRMKLPIFVARQWVRHRTASLNEISGRYSLMKDDFYIPEAEQVCVQSKDNKQGRGESLDASQSELFRTDLSVEQQELYGKYKSRIDQGVAKELSRIDLPLSLYTEWYWKQNLHNMLHLVNLRMDSHAQYEIRVYANALWDIVKAVAPIACEAFEEYVLEAKTFSKTELDILKTILKANHSELKDDYMLNILGKRGLEEFKNKLGL